jgi:membrane-bound lytic murein transglycosylase D
MEKSSMTSHRYSRTAWLAALLLLALSGCQTMVQAPSPVRAVGSPTASPAITRDTTTGQPAAPAGELKDLVSAQPVSVEVAEAPSSVAEEAVPDLWDRIRNGLSMPALESKLVRTHEVWYASRPDYMDRMTTRAEMYLFYIVEEVERRGLPMELALLPFIESAFNPQAESRARAMGMWQFMPATGRHFDLNQNHFFDERRDVMASTRAALDYLEQLHAEFKDWHLALASYNWGEGNVRRALKRNARLRKPQTYEALRMPRETRNYVPKLLAFANIIKDPKRFQVALPVIPDHPYFDVVTVEADIDVALVADLARVSEDDFRALNPSIKHPVILSAGMPKILLPWENSVLYSNNLADYTGPLASWTVYVTPRNMNTSRIARTVGMSDAELRRVNDIPKGRIVRKGSTLLVKRGAKVKNDVSERIAEHGQVRLTSVRGTVRVRIRAKTGETVASMARRLGVSAQSLAKWNRLSTRTRLAKDQRLTVYLPRNYGKRKRR